MDAVFADVGDGDDNDGLDNSSADEAFGGLVNAPFHAAKRSRCVENVLSVVQIQNGIICFAKIGGSPAADTPKYRAGSREFWTETRGAI